MYSLRVKNYQSIKEVYLPIKGFTVLVGKTNRGKSALLRSLRTVLRNDWDKSFIRHGESETEIEFRIESLEKIQKMFPAMDITSICVTKPSNEYILTCRDGTELKYPKVGKDVPERLQDMNLSRIETEREDAFDLNFQSQLDPLFLITATEVEATSFLNKVFDISRFERALRNMKSDDITLSRDLSASEGKIAELGKTLAETVVAHQGVTAQLNSVTAQLDTVENLDSRLKHLLEAIQTGRGYFSERDQLRIVAESLKGVITCRDLYKSLTQIQSEIEKLREDSHKIGTDTKEIESLRHALVVGELLPRYETIEIKLSGLSPIETVMFLLESVGSARKEIETVSQTCQELTRIQTLVQSWCEISTVLGEIANVGTQRVDADTQRIRSETYQTVVKKLNELGSIREGIGLQTNLESNRHGLQHERIRFESFQALYEATLQRSGTCPTCGNTCGGSHA